MYHTMMESANDIVEISHASVVTSKDETHLTQSHNVHIAKNQYTHKVTLFHCGHNFGSSSSIHMVRLQREAFFQ